MLIGIGGFKHHVNKEPTLRQRLHVRWQEEVVGAGFAYVIWLLQICIAGKTGLQVYGEKTLLIGAQLDITGKVLSQSDCLGC